MSAGLRQLRGMAWTAVAVLTILPACATSSGREVPAVIVDPTPASRAALRLAVQRALHSDPILLADNALTHSNLLPIERVRRRDPQGRPLNGLDVGGRPELFHLVKSAEDCVLIHDDTEQLRQVLAATKCSPVPPKK